MSTATPVSDVLNALRERWFVILVAAIIGLVVGAIAYVVLDQDYEATAVFAVEPVASTPLTGDPGNLNMATELVVAQSQPVVERTAAELGEVPRSVDAALEVTVPRNSNALAFTFSADEPAVAAEGANAAARAYGEERAGLVDSVYSEAESDLEKSIVATQAQLTEVEAGSAQESLLEAQLAGQQARLAELTGTDFYPGTLVSPAVPPSSASGPGRTSLLLAGLALGLLIGAFVALVMSRGDGQRRSDI